MTTITYLTTAELEAGLEHIRNSPRDLGQLELIVLRPAEDEREVLQEGELTLQDGLVGDTWKIRPSSRMPEGLPHPEMQLNIINARLISLLTQDKDRWPLAGDQLYLDLDLSLENLPPGTRLALGSAIIEITAQPHTGCKKFAARYGLDAMKFVNAPENKPLRLRGINARVIQPGRIRVGDIAHKVEG